MSTKKNLLIAACYSGALVLGMILGPKFHREDLNSRNGSFKIFQAGGDGGKVEQVLNIIRENYVDPIKTDSLQNLAIDEILNNLDPHSAYLPPVEARMFTDDMEGNYNGIGIEYQLLNDTLIVTYINKMGPAAKAGLQSGDQIVKIEDQNIAGVGILPPKIVSLIRGRQTTLVELTVRRYGSNEDIIFKVPREKVTVSSIDVSYLIEDRVGYVKISKFGAKTDEDFLFELRRLKKQGMKGLIVDLRGNGGGYLNAATALADQFLGDQELIVYTQGEHEPRTDYLATDAGDYENGKLVILIDEGTASASEIIAGALQDLDRATVVGRRSFGKGLVQEQFNFGDGSALNLTVARYYTPSGRSIQKPYTRGRIEYFKEISNRIKNGELVFDQKHLMDSLYSTKDKYFKTASGRVVFGGGGVMPDIYVPVDTVGHTPLYYSLSSKAVLNELVYSYLIKKARPTSLKDFLDKFSLSNNQYKQLQVLAERKKIKFTPEELKEANGPIMLDIRALLARFYFGEDAYYRVLNETDNMIEKSLAVLK